MRIKTWIGIALGALVVGSLMVPAAAATPKQASSSDTVLIAQINQVTNPATPGTKLTYGKQTLTAWAKMVNASGGINGHKIKIVAMDDATDPAQASANVKKMIDAGAVAIVGNTATSTFSVWQPIAKEAGVPIVGGGCYSISGNSDQNFFCVTTTAVSPGLKAQTKLVAEQGGKSFGITYASDIPAAAAAAPLMKALATADGLKWTDAVGTTNTQPDYTAACVTFKQANTTDVGIEGAPLLQNLARDCARQDYYPKWTSGDGQISQNAWLKDPNIKEAIAAVYSFPYMLAKGDTPEQTKSLKTFHKAMKKYAPSVLKSDSKQPATTTWTAALAFGQALANVPAGTPVTAESITAGLNAFKDETLGGLAPNPLTFTAGQEHPVNACWWGEVLKNHKLKAPQGMKTTCTP